MRECANAEGAALAGRGSPAQREGAHLCGIINLETEMKHEERSAAPSQPNYFNYELPRISANG